MVVGVSFTTADRGFRWMPGAGMSELPSLGGSVNAGATAISTDAAVIVGWCRLSSGSHAVRWTASGIADVGVPPFRASALPWAASADASVLAGAAASGSSDTTAFVLDAQGWADLGVLPGDAQSRAGAVSADGAVVVGYSWGQTALFSHGFRWSRSQGLTAMGTLPGRSSSTPLGVSGDGSVIVGATGPGTDPDGFVWTRWDGMQSARTVLERFGVNLAGWSNVEPQAITIDGRTLAGTARGATGYRAWVATLPEGFGCNANCDGGTTDPVLNVGDFVCFLTRYAAGEPSANCDGSTSPPVLNVNDFVCFQERFAAGCP
jgi:probable HAF family extracellular repeat protein